MTDPSPKGDGLLSWLLGGLLVGLALLGAVVLAYYIGYERGQDDVAAPPTMTQPVETTTAPAATTTEPSAPDGAAVFAQAGCGSCHVLGAADASGTVGPNLDELGPTREQVAAVVTDGRGAMPSFADQLDAEEIEAVAAYVAESAGG